MKIEKLSENQIRCTLNKADLASRQLKISELAYGSEKAKELFRDMIQQASYELGFDAEDIPLMIEAIPVSADCIVLIVTKVDDPEELDTRFSKFTPAEEDDEDFGDFDYPFTDFDSLETIEAPNNTAAIPSADEELSETIPAKDQTSDSPESDEILNIFDKVTEYFNKNISNNTKQENKAANASLNKPKANTSKQISAEDTDTITRIFSFDSLDNFTSAAISVLPVYNDKNHLYKNPANNMYYLVLEKNHSSSVDFNKTCNILSEYGTKENMPKNSILYFKGHFEKIIENRAIQIMAKL